jgi:hypothetical protein
MVDVHDRPRQLLIKTGRESGNRVRVTVRDAGLGLPPQNLDSLFEAFYTTKSGGMGIGLFVSRSMSRGMTGVFGPSRTMDQAPPSRSPFRFRRNEQVGASWATSRGARPKRYRPSPAK